VALHLAVVFTSLAGSSQARMVSGGLDSFGVGTPFAALTPVLWGGWAVATTIGTALCVSILLSALLADTRADARVTRIILSPGGVAPTDQIRDQIRGLIITGALAETQRLPSVRQLA